MRWLKRKWAEINAWLMLAVVAFCGLSFALFELAMLSDLNSPSESLLRDLSGFGGALFIAFTLAFGAVAISDHWDRAERQNWVGIGTGFGLGGLVGVGAAIATAAHVEAGHSGALDLAGLAAAVAGPLMLGVLVLTLAASALLPPD